MGPWEAGMWERDSDGGELPDRASGSCHTRLISPVTRREARPLTRCAVQQVMKAGRMALGWHEPGAVRKETHQTGCHVHHVEQTPPSLILLQWDSWEYGVCSSLMDLFVSSPADVTQTYSYMFYFSPSNIFMQPRFGRVSFSIRCPHEPWGTNCPDHGFGGLIPWSFADYLARLSGIKLQLLNRENAEGFANVFLVKDSHDEEESKMLPLFCELPFKGRIHRVCFPHPQGLTKKTIIVQILCENGREKQIDVTAAATMKRLWPGRGWWSWSEGR